MTTDAKAQNVVFVPWGDIGTLCVFLAMSVFVICLHWNNGCCSDAIEIVINTNIDAISFVISMSRHLQS